MKILVGLLKANSGQIYIDGKNISTDTEEIRNLLGICPQQNILFKNLTVKEHLKFFCRLKGVRDRVDTKTQIKSSSLAVGLNSHLNKNVQKLSPGWKRKLAVAAGLCGNSKILIFDEPTRGLDPEGKKEFWNMLIKLKKQKTIFVSTNDIEEAEILGDRVAILSNGQCEAVGSVNELKRKYEKGYRLICEKREDFDSLKFLEFLRNHSRNACLICENQVEAIFRLDEEYLNCFRNLFKALEDKPRNFGVKNFACKMPSMEEIILRVDTHKFFSPCKPSQVQIPTTDLKIKKNCKKCFYQIFAIFLKKFLLLCRNFKLILILAILSIYLLFCLSLHTDLDPPKLKISLDQYFETVTVFSNKQAPLTSRNYTVLFEDEKDQIFRTSNPDPAVKNGFSAEGIKSNYTQFLKKTPIGAFITGKKSWIYFNREF